MLDMKREVGHPFVSNEEGQNYEGNEVDFDPTSKILSMKTTKMMTIKVLVRSSSSWVAHRSSN